MSHVRGDNHARPGDVAAVADRARTAAGTVGGRPVVVAIDGPAGSGKSSLATLVAAELDAPTVHLDDMYPGWDGLAAAPALLAAQVLEPLHRDESAAFRRFDWDADRFADLVHVRRSRFLVVEGCGCSAGVASPYVDVRVWVEAEPVTRKRRGLERDGDAFAPHWERWAAQEEALFGRDGTRGRADLVVVTDG